MKNFWQKSWDWQPPEEWLRIRTIDAHTEGEPLRIIVDGFPELPGETILDRRRLAKEKYDHLRRALMWEPRGHADMYGCILTPAVSENADFGVLFIHNEGFSTMCGHGIIAVTKTAVETAMVPVTEPQTTVRIDTPAGLVTAYAHVKNGLVQKVSFHNVPSFVFASDEKIEVQGLGEVRYDIAFGGAFYAFVDANALGIAMTPDNYRGLIEAGMAIKRRVMETRPIVHPYEQDLNFLYGTIFTGQPYAQNAHSRNVCIFAEGEVDRSPTGTGVSARMALHYARGEIKAGEEMIIESIIGSTFAGKVAETVQFGPYEAVIPEVSGTAYITGKHEFLIDPRDGLKDGFILR
ncbi:MAG TPA: proline racemase [Caldithrix abyssi]|uniref:Proline racemase n=1 Tax=Caldithrix abyssi TaxID=187145 RepID=A0A7V4WU09_CALAY|nr:proline racemase [Caldithrix abyssi]